MSGRSKTSSFGTNSRINHDASVYYAARLNSGLLTGEAQSEPDQPFPLDCRNRIFTASAETMQDIPDSSLHLMVTSPPYNVTKTYDADLSLGEYLEVLRRVFQETYRVLVHGGRAWIIVAHLGRKPCLPLTAYITHLMSEIGFLMRGEIIWNKAAGAGVSMAWGSWMSASNPVLRDTHEYILIFSKGTYKRQKPEGKENSISREQFMEWTKSVWQIPPESARKIGHPAPFPVELPYRLIQLFTYTGDIVLDPFMGSGSTALAALKAGRFYVGYEVNAQYAELASQRIARNIV